ncbi:MAG: ABC transporter ATP-binding protein [Armatimonadota bacterium]
MNSIAVDRADKRIGQVWALKNISLEIPSGEIFGVFGRSGSGKSTLLKLIAGLNQPTAGTVVLQSSGSDDPAWLDSQVSIAFQTPGLAPELTVIENLRLFSSLWNTRRKGKMGRTAMFLELLGLSNVRNRRVCKLSDGHKCAAELARAFISDARITAIDGLIERLDHPTRRKTWEYILARKRQGSTFIIATSSAKEALLCDKLAVLSQGRLVFAGKPGELLSAVQNEVVVVESIHGPLINSKLRDRFGAAVTERNGTIEIKSPDADSDAAWVLSELKSDVGCVYLRQPTLDDALDRIEGS